MLDYFKKLFIKKSKNDLKDEIITAEYLFADDNNNMATSCTECFFIESCKDKKQHRDECDFTVELKDFNPNEDSILIIDDNSGVISFLKDDIDYLIKTKVINETTNIITLTGTLAGFSFKSIQEKANGLNIKWAIIDITLGGSIMTDKGNIKYTGVDVYEMLMKYNPEARFIFYTGNNLNPYIKANKKLIDQFYEASNGRNIGDFVLFKTSMDMETRRKFLKNNLFNEKDQ